MIGQYSMLYENIGPYKYRFCEQCETLIFAWLPRELKKRGKKTSIGLQHLLYFAQVKLIQIK